jgi:VanZ family protein
MALPKRQPIADQPLRPLGREPSPALRATVAVASHHGFCRLLFALLAGVVAVGCLLPAAALPLFEVSDKIQHFAAFAALGAIGALAFPGRRAIVLLAITLFAFGCLLEGLQLFVPSRQTALGDVIANSLGIVVGIASGAVGLTLILAKARMPLRADARHADD